MPRLPAPDEIVLDLNVGKIGVRFRPDSNQRSNRVDGDVFGEMRQRDPEFGPTLPPDKFASVLGNDCSEIAVEWPSQIVSTGLPFAIVPIRDSKTLANLKPDLVRVGALLEGTGARFCYFISPERQGWREVRARMFFWRRRSGHWISCWLCHQLDVQNGLAKSDEQILIHQGVEARRPSEIFVRATRDGEKVTNVRVGGYAVEVLRGTVSLEK